MDYVGLALFSVVGTQVAGDAGFNLVGCTLVGCVAGLGGRTINNLLFGATRNGVFWARNSLYLAVAIGSSVLTFFAWPIYCDQTSKYYLEHVIGKERLEEDGSVNKDEFVNVCEHDHEFLATIRNIMLPKSNDNEELTAGELFHLIDLDSSGTIDSDELKFLVQEHIRNDLSGRSSWGYSFGPTPDCCSNVWSHNVPGRSSPRCICWERPCSCIPKLCNGHRCWEYCVCFDKGACLERISSAGNC